MTSTERLQAVIGRLEAKGMSGFKPIPGPKTHLATKEELENAFAEILEAIEDGRTVLKFSFEGRK